MSQFNTRIPEDLIKEVKIICIEKNIKVNAAVKEALENWIEENRISRNTSHQKEVDQKQEPVSKLHNHKALKEIIQTYFKGIGLSIDELAVEMNISIFELNKVLDGELPVTNEIASKLSCTLGNTTEYWLSLADN